MISFDDDASTLGPSDDDAPKSDPEYEYAIRHRRATFTQWATAWFFSKKKFNESAVGRERWRRYRDGSLFDAFVAREGSVWDAYYCDDVPAAAALTLKRKSLWAKATRTDEAFLHILTNAPSEAASDASAVAALDLLSQCDRMSDRARDFLPIIARTQLLAAIYGVVTDALYILDEAARRLAPGADRTRLHTKPDALVANAREALKAIGERLDWAAKRAAQFYFLFGLVIGTAAIGAASPLVAAVLRSTFASPNAGWAWAAGAIGAAVSVLLRVRSDGLTLDYEVGRSRLFLLGFIRPLLGALSGLLLFAAAVAAVIPLEKPRDPAQRTALYLIASFAAGFNERWFQDMLANVGERLQLSSGQTKPEGDGSDAPPE